VGETAANNKKSSEELIYLLDLKPGGKRNEITTWAAKEQRFKHIGTACFAWTFELL